MTDVIRLAGPDDAPLLARLNAAVHDWHVAAYPDRFVASPDPTELAQFFVATLARPDVEIALCDRGGYAVGFIWVEVRVHPETALTRVRKVLYVHALAVVERARRQGVATALMAWAANRSQELAVDALALDHWADKAAASALYSAQGFRPERMVLSRP